MQQYSPEQLTAIASFFAGRPIQVSRGPGNQAFIGEDRFNLDGADWGILARARPDQYRQLLQNVKFLNAVHSFGHELGHIIKGHGSDFSIDAQGNTHQDINYDPKAVGTTEWLANNWVHNHARALFSRLGFNPVQSRSLARALNHNEGFVRE